MFLKAFGCKAKIIAFSFVYYKQYKDVHSYFLSVSFFGNTLLARTENIKSSLTKNPYLKQWNNICFIYSDSAVYFL